MNEHREEVPSERSKEDSGSPDEVFMGAWWSVERVKGKYFLEYISGELSGMLKRIEITKSDFDQMKDGRLSCDELCRKYNAS